MKNKKALNEALLEAIEHENFNKIDELLGAGVIPSDEALDTAICVGSRVLFEKFIDLDVRPGQLTLDFALESRDLKIIDVVFQLKPTPSKNTLTFAVRTKSKDIVQRVIELGARPDKNSLNEAVKTGDMAIIEMVLAMGVKVDKESLFAAVESRKYGVVQRMLELKAPIFGHTLRVACRWGINDHILQLLFDAGAMPDKGILHELRGYGNWDCSSSKFTFTMGLIARSPEIYRLDALRGVPDEPRRQVQKLVEELAGNQHELQKIGRLLGLFHRANVVPLSRDVLIFIATFCRINNAHSASEVRKIINANFDLLFQNADNDDFSNVRVKNVCLESPKGSASKNNALKNQFFTAPIDEKQSDAKHAKTSFKRTS